MYKRQSSASVLYYEDIVTYSDNRSEPIEIIARPVPVFKNGGKLVMQRGAGICLTTVSYTHLDVYKRQVSVLV